jgi:hypothetical protein
MFSLKSARDSIKNLFEKYPAVLSGYFLVGYSFIALIRLLIKAKRGILGAEDVYDVFSALPFMWLLAMSVVKMVQERSHLHQMQHELAREQLQRQIIEIQLNAFKEAEKALQHKINNPLAVIALSLSRLKHGVQRDHELLDETNDIEYASRTIGSVLTDFTKTHFRRASETAPPCHHVS